MHFLLLSQADGTQSDIVILQHFRQQFECMGDWHSLLSRQTDSMRLMMLTLAGGLG